MAISATGSTTFHHLFLFLTPCHTIHTTSNAVNTAKISSIENGIHETLHERAAETAGYTVVAYHSPTATLLRAAKTNAARNARSI